MNATRRSRFFLILELATVIAVVGMISTGLVMRVLLPLEGMESLHRGWSIWGWGRHNWAALHFNLSLAVVALLVIQLVLHWDRVCQIATRWLLRREAADVPDSRVQRHAIGAGLTALLVIAISVFVWAAAGSLDTSGRGERDLPAVFRDQPVSAGTTP